MADERLYGAVAEKMSAGIPEENVRTELHGKWPDTDINGALAVWKLRNSSFTLSKHVPRTEYHKPLEGNTFFQFALIFILLVSAPGAYGLITGVVIPVATNEPIQQASVQEQYDLLRDVPSLIPVSPLGAIIPKKEPAPEPTVAYVPPSSTPAKPTPTPTPVPAPTPVEGTPPAISFTARSKTIVIGSRATVDWNAPTAISCTGTGFTTDNFKKGSARLTITSNITVSISCTNAGGTSSRSLTITAVPKSTPIPPEPTPTPTPVPDPIPVPTPTPTPTTTPPAPIPTPTPTPTPTPPPAPGEATAATFATVLKTATPGSTITINQPFSFNVENLNIPAPGTTVMCGSSAAISPPPMKYSSLNNVQGVTFKGCKFLQSFYVNNAQRLHFKNNDFSGPGPLESAKVALILRVSNNVTVTNNKFHHTNSGISIQSTSHSMTISDNDFYELWYDAITGSTNGPMTIERNTFTNFRGPALHLDAIQLYSANHSIPVDRVTVRDNVYVRGTGTPAQFIFLTDSGSGYTNATVTGNGAWGEGWWGIGLYGASDSLISNNYLQGSTELFPRTPPGQQVLIPWIKAGSPGTNLVITDNLLPAPSADDSGLRAWLSSRGNGRFPITLGPEYPHYADASETRKPSTLLASVYTASEWISTLWNSILNLIYSLFNR
ncbi:MAG: putative membrane protein [Parcubacteria bacterium C7867-007]|nr:MAG: putative membrane protein [Parcubacteria bacterium C7867-007]